MKKYNLKPGNHQFIPGSPAVHNNDNLTDHEAEWYLARYPHIAELFAPWPPKGGVSREQNRISRKRTMKKITNQKTPPSGGWGAPK